MALIRIIWNYLISSQGIPISDSTRVFENRHFSGWRPLQRVSGRALLLHVGRESSENFVGKRSTPASKSISSPLAVSTSVPPKHAATRVFPVVGHPDSVHIHGCFDDRDDPKVDGVLLYDPMGMLPKKSSHLG
jgi:hypothetical protein